MARSRYWGKNAHLADRAGRAVEKELSKIHPLTFIIPAIFLIIGIVLGYIGGSVLMKEDGFTLLGEKNITVFVGEDFSYTDEGFACIALGKDFSDKVKVESNMTLTSGTYTVSTAAEGRYYISYTCEDALFFSGVRLVRTVTVVERKGGA